MNGTRFGKVPGRGRCPRGIARPFAMPRGPTTQAVTHGGVLVKRKTITELEATAYHEAGHAVASVRLERSISYVTIIPKGDSLGHVRYRGRSNRSESSWRGEGFLTRDAITTLAGPLAERRYRGRGNHIGATSDYHTLSDTALHHLGNVEVANTWLRYCQARAVALLNAPGVWDQVEAVARELLARNALTGDEVRSVCFAALSTAIARRRVFEDTPGTPPATPPPAAPTRRRGNPACTIPAPRIARPAPASSARTR